MQLRFFLSTVLLGRISVRNPALVLPTLRKTLLLLLSELQQFGGDTVNQVSLMYYFSLLFCSFLYFFSFRFLLLLAARVVSWFSRQRESYITGGVVKDAQPPRRRAARVVETLRVVLSLSLHLSRLHRMFSIDITGGVVKDAQFARWRVARAVETLRVCGAECTGAEAEGTLRRSRWRQRQ
jgi:hypothetical protein